MDKSTYKTLSTMTADLQRRFDFMLKAMTIESAQSATETNSNIEKEPNPEQEQSESEISEVTNPLAPIPAEVPQGLDTTSHQEESKTALEDTSSAYTELPEMLNYIMKVTSPSES
jgi:hypothetical protein